jgi:hypothetical protein
MTDIPSRPAAGASERVLKTIRHSILANLLILLAAALAYRTSPGFGLLGDAVFLISENAFMRDWSAGMDMVTNDYFWAQAQEAIGYWRPWTKVSWWLETLVLGGGSWVYHVVSVLWLAVTAMGARALAIAMRINPGWALLAGLLVCLHPVAIEPTSLIMARSDLVCAAGVVWAQVALLRGVETGRASAWIGLVLATVLAFGSKELAVVLIPLTALHALSFRLRDGSLNTKRWAIGGGLVMATTVAWAVCRRLVLGPSADADFSMKPVRIVVGLAQYLKGTLPWSLDPGVRNIPVAQLDSPALVAGSMTVCAAILVVGGVMLWKRRFGLLVLWCWWGGALAPVVLPERMRVPGASGVLPLSDRWALQSMIALAIIAVAVAQELPSTLLKRLVVGISFVWIAATLALAPVQRAPYESGLTLLSLEDDDYLATPEQYRTPVVTCQYYSRALVRASSDRDLNASLRAWASLTEHECNVQGDQQFNMLVVLVENGMWTEARAVAEQYATSLRSNRDYYRGQHLLGVVFGQTGEPERALMHLAQALSGGVDTCEVAAPMARAQADIGDFASAGRWTLAAGRCQRGSDDPDILLLASDLYVQGGLWAEANALLSQINVPALPPPMRAQYDWLRSRVQAGEGSGGGL